MYIFKEDLLFEKERAQAEREGWRERGNPQADCPVSVEPEAGLHLTTSGS